MFGALIADSEKLHDPRLYHDRLILGLTGMMSEAELHQIRTRLHAGGRHKAERGELRIFLPAGLARQADGAITLNPDQEVQARLRLIFDKFVELGSARAVRKYLSENYLLVPTHHNSAPAHNRIEWSVPSGSNIRYILHNPAYAGAYVYGRRATDPARRKPGQPGSGIILLPIDKWAVCIRDTRTIDVMETRKSPMPGKNERQGRSANIFFFHEGSLHGHGEQEGQESAWSFDWRGVGEITGRGAVGQ